jgi:hypothetical protein
MTRIRRSTVVSLLLVLAYLGFFVWYTPLGGPLSSDEIEHYVGLFVERGIDPEGEQRLRRFLEEDTGDDFVMVNVIELRESPQLVEGVEPGDTSSAVLGKYMEYMWPALFKRACHPVLFGSAAAGALDVWGIDGARQWSQGAGMRYRSRRDMMEISTNPAFQGRHEFKTSAMAKTIAFPIDPWFQLGDPRLVAGLILLICLLVLRLLARPGGAAVKPAGPVS